MASAIWTDNKKFLRGKGKEGNAFLKTAIPSTFELVIQSDSDTPPALWIKSFTDSSKAPHMSTSRVIHAEGPNLDSLPI